MSKYTVDGKDKQQHICRIGFDPGLNTFFGQVLDLQLEREAEAAERRLEEALTSKREHDKGDVRAASRDTMILWVGTSPDEIQTAEELASAVAAYVELDEEMITRLNDDKTREAHPPTGLQATMHEFIRAAGRANSSGGNGNS